MSVSNPEPTRDSSTATSDPDLSIRVIETVAAALDVDPIDCPPLYEVVDLSALNELFEGRSNVRGRVSFEYVGYAVTVESDGTVALGEPDEP